MEIPWEAIFGAAGGSAVVTVLGVIFAQKLIENAFANVEETHRKQLEVAGNIDLDLRGRRMTAYEIVWHHMRALPKWPCPLTISYKDLFGLGEKFTQWYFDGGGMFLSEKARDAYGHMQDAIVLVMDPRKTGMIDPKKPGDVTAEEYEAVRETCSAFRTEITNDLLSRRAAPLN